MTAPRRRPAWLLFLLSLALLLAACTSGTTSGSTIGADGRDTDITAPVDGPPREGGELVYGLAAETSGWNPAIAQWANSGYLVAGAIFDRLMAYDEAGDVVPFLAESMSSNEDFTVWTIGLRPDVAFHDGSMLDAAVIKANLEAHLASPITAATLAPIESIVVVDDLTVQVQMSTPWSTFPHLLTAQPGYVMALSMIDNPQGNTNPVGTGPFEFVSWAQDSQLVVKRYDDYWQEGLPYLDTITFRVITDNTARSASLQNGDIDVLETGDARQIQRLTAEAEAGRLQISVDREGETSETFLALNTSMPPFDDLLARQAVAYGINTQQLSDVVYAGLFQPARGPFKESSPWYAETDYPTYDPARAQELATEYEQKYGEPLRFTANITPQPEIQEIAQLVQSQLQAAGIEVELNTLEQTSLILEALGGTYEATGFILFGSPHLDREYVFLHQDNTDGAVALAFTRMKNERLSAALDAARATDDIDEQIAQFKIVQEELASDLNFIFLVHNESATASTNSVRDIKNWTLPDGTPGSTNEGALHPLAQVWLAE